MKHIFEDNEKGQCKAIINGFVGPCGCSEDNEIHEQWGELPERKEKEDCDSCSG